MHEHNTCEHKLEFCKTCNTVYCKKCKTEWEKKTTPLTLGTNNVFPCTSITNVPAYNPYVTPVAPSTISPNTIIT